MKKHKHTRIHHLMEPILGEHKRRHVDTAQQMYKSFRARARAERTFLQKLADLVTSVAGSMSFAVFHLFWFGIWLSINLGLVPVIPAFDPFPFGLLTMIVSLEAIFLSIFVLISQNREEEIATLREEVGFQITMHSELEITKLINMVSDVQKHLGMKVKDPDLELMKQVIDPGAIEREIQQES